MSTETDPQVRAGGRRPAADPKSMPLGHDLPRVPRRYGQWAGAVLFVVMAVLLAGWFWQQKSDQEAVLAMAEPVAAGAVITAEDLAIVEVSGVDGAIPSADSSSVVGSTAAVGLVDGQILTRDMVTSDPLPGPGERVVGLQLDATRAPAGLHPATLSWCSRCRRRVTRAHRASSTPRPSWHPTRRSHRRRRSRARGPG